MSILLWVMASVGQSETQCPQRLQFFAVVWATILSSCIEKLKGHLMAHVPHALHFS
jgi:hypothetical protein